MSTTSSTPTNRQPTETGPCCPKDAGVTNACPAGATSGNTTLLETGQFMWQMQLLSVDAIGGKGWSFDLNYLSSSGITGIMGPGFDTRLNYFLVLLAGDDVELNSGNTTTQVFISAGSGAYSSLGNETSAVLKRTDAGTEDDLFTLTSSDGNISQFWGFHSSIATPGRLKSTTDRYGNKQTLTWSEAGGKVQLTSVTDSYGRTITYRYYGPEFAYQVREIEDFLGRKLSFQYREEVLSASTVYLLVAAVLPSVFKAADGNTYPGGRAYVFDYDAGGILKNTPPDLIRVWYPNEVAPYLDEATRTVDVDAVYAAAAPRYSVEYGTDPGETDEFGRVLRETVGEIHPVRYQQEVLSDHPVAYFELSERSGIVAHNSSDPNNPGVYLPNNGSSWSGGTRGVAGPLSDGTTAVEFNGTTGQVDAGHVADFSSFSVELWVKTTESSEAQLFMRTFPSSPFHGFGMAVGAWPPATPNKLAAWIGDGTWRSGNVSINDGQWHHCVITFDNHVLKFFVDGVLDKTFTGLTFTDSSSPTTHVQFPISNTACTLDEAALYDYALSAERIRAHFVARQGAGGCVGGTYTYAYTTGITFPTNIIDGTDPIVSRTTMTDPNGNVTVHDFNANGMVVRLEVEDNRDKNSLQTGPYVTWTKYNDQNQVLLQVLPEGNSIDYAYESGTVVGMADTYIRRRGLLLRETRYPGNSIGVPNTRSGSNGQIELTRIYFYEPLFNQRCAVIETRSNPINGSTFWTPQNDGTTPILTNRTRFATITYFDYQKNQKSTIENDSGLQMLLGLTSTEIGLLLDHVNKQLNSPIDQGPLPPGFQWSLGDINGDGTGDGASSGLAAAAIRGNVVKVKHPPAYQLVPSSGANPWEWASQAREEIFTVNARGQATTHTDPEGNLTVYVRYPENDPEGDGRFIAGSLSNLQYGRVKEIHVDANPDHVMSLVGADGDLVDFVPGKISRTNTPGSYQDLTTRHEGTSGCATCSYDALGNVLTTTDARGFTTVNERNELGEVYRTTSARPYEFRTEIHYDANRNVTRVDTEDKVVAFTSDDPTDAAFAKFVPTGNLADGVAHVPMKAGPGGSVRPGWFTNLYRYDILDQKTQEDIDASGASGGEPSSLVTSFGYDANGNLTKITKPLGNTVEYDYDERNLRIAERVGRAVPTYESQVLASTPVAYWKLDERAGSSAADSSGNGTTGTYIGAITHDEPGPIACLCSGGGAAALNGSNAYVSASDADLNVTGEITLEAWVNVAAFPASGNHATIISKGFDGSKTGYYLGIHNDGGTLKLIAGADDTLNAASWNISGWSTATWVHVAAAFTGVHWKLFFNGDEKVSTGTVKPAVLSDASLLIGAYDNDGTASRFLDATVAQVAVYPSALTEAQLESHYKIGTNTTTSATYFQGAVTITSYDKNGNLLKRIGATNRNAGVGGEATSLTATIENAFGCGTDLVHTGDYALENTYDGFDRVISAKDAVGNLAEFKHDPDGRVVESTVKGPNGGATPIVRTGTSNLLQMSIARFDEAGRQYESQAQAFIADGNNLPSGDRDVTQVFGGLATNSETNRAGDYEMADGTGVASGEHADSYILTRTVFDKAGRVTAVGQDNTAISTSEYDGASRRILSTDSLGNSVEYVYDGNSNVIFTTRTEKCTITAPEVEDEIFRSAARYDALNRLVISATQGADGLIDDILIPGPAGTCCSQASGGCCDPEAETQSSTIFTLTGYDSRGNTTLTVDPKGNSVIAVYDGAGRPVESLQLLRQNGQGDNPPAANASFTTAGGGANAGAIRTQTIYDANSNVTRLIDDRGGTTSYEYDTLDRQTKMIFHDGSTRTIDYNAASDVKVYTDENGSVFTNTFDALGRKTACAIAPAPGVAGYDPVDPEPGTRGTVEQAFEYDGLSRLTKSTDTTEVDGGTPQDAVVITIFDSLGRFIEERQTFDGNDRDVTQQEWTSIVATIFTFPNDRQTTNTFDALYRRTEVIETSGPSSIAAWQFFGPGRVAEVQLANGLICSFMNNDRTHSAVQEGVANPAWGDDVSDRLGYDGSGRMVTKRYVSSGIDGGTDGYNVPVTIAVGFTTSFDKSSNKLYERHLHAEDRSHLYEPFVSGVPHGGYDSLDRLRQYQRGTLASGGGSISSPITLPNAKESQTYNLDSLGNWQSTAIDPVGASAFNQVRQHNKLNQITSTKDGASAKVSFDYDGVPASSGGESNGNLKNDGVRLYIYDAFNRLTTVYKDPNGTPDPIGTYSYDAGGRRIRKVVSNGGLTGSIPNGTTDFAYTRWRIVEELNPLGGGGSTDTPIKQYVWGIYLDELIQQKNITALNNFGANEDLYPLQDLLYRTIGLADNAGTVREAYDCDAYGNTLIFRNSGTPPTQIGYVNSDIETGPPTCSFIYVGQLYNDEAAIYSYKNRYYIPSFGAFISRDPIGYNDGPCLYGYVHRNPVSKIDPIGYHTTSIDAGCKDKCGPDVTAWFYNDVALHIKLTAQLGSWPGQFARQFGEQLADLLSYKWMDFSVAGCGTGKCIHTVQLAGTCLRKNQLGNIAFGILISMYQIKGWSIKNMAAYGYGVGKYYDSKHPHAINFGKWAGSIRMDNLAAFGLGAAIAGTGDWSPRSYLSWRSMMTTLLQTGAGMSEFADSLLNFVGRPSPQALTPSHLTFVPEFGGFDTRSCRPCDKTRHVLSQGSIGWDQILHDMYEKSKSQKSFEDWRKFYYENYAN